MPDPDPVTAQPGRTSPPWTADGTVYTSTAAGCRTSPPRPACGCHSDTAATTKTTASRSGPVEHWFQACKATSRQQFDLILACGSAGAAKHAGRATELRPDWEQVKFEVMLRALRGKFALEPYRSGLVRTHRRPLAEDSPTDFIWGCRDTDSGHDGQNLLGLALMRVREELVADVRTRLRALAPGH